MNYNVLLEMSNKLDIDWDEIRRYHYIFNDIGIIPGSVSIILNPKKSRHNKNKGVFIHDGIAVAKQRNGNNVIIKLQYNDISKKTKVLYSFFLLDDGLYFVRDYQQSRHGDSIEFSYYDKESCNVAIEQNVKNSMKTISKFENIGIREDYIERAKIYDIEYEGGFAHYVRKIDKTTKVRSLNRRGN